MLQLATLCLLQIEVLLFVQMSLVFVQTIQTTTQSLIIVIAVTVSVNNGKNSLAVKKERGQVK